MEHDTNETPGATRLQRRLPGRDRAEHILAEATRFFAELGLEGRTRDLAQRLGVTQALLYRYFPTKAALIDKVYEREFGGRWEPTWDTLLDDRSKPTAERLTGFYRAYLEGMSGTRIRLFVHAGLQGGELARHYAPILTDRIVRPVISALRADAGLPDLDTRPMTQGERDLALGLHGSILFLMIRKHVFGRPMPDDLRELVAMQIRVFVAGAPAELERQLHETPGEPVPLREAC